MAFILILLLFINDLVNAVAQTAARYEITHEDMPLLEENPAQYSFYYSPVFQEALKKYAYEQQLTDENEPYIFSLSLADLLGTLKYRYHTLLNAPDVNNICYFPPSEVCVENAAFNRQFAAFLDIRISMSNLDDQAALYEVKTQNEELYKVWELLSRIQYQGTNVYYKRLTLKEYAELRKDKFFVIPPAVPFWFFQHFE